jgi:hypothetical protein
MDEDPDFAPSNVEDMAGKDEFGGGHETTDGDFFKDASGPDPLSALLGGRTASEGVDVDMGDMGAYFETSLAGDTRDNETDHSDDLLTDVLDSLDQPGMKQEHDTEPNMEVPAAIPGVSLYQKVGPLTDQHPTGDHVIQAILIVKPINYLSHLSAKDQPDPLELV